LCSAFRVSLLVLLLLIPPATAEAGELKICADPNNLPFSNDKREGFENKIIEIVARELGDTLDYVWRAQRRGLVTAALDEGICDIIPGIGSVNGVLLTYPPYYRSSYAFVTRAGTAAISSFDDPRLRMLRVGVQLVGDDGANPPPSVALSRRGIIDNVRGYSVVGDYAQANPPARVIDAVAKGEVDVAIAWGPTAAYFAAREQAPLTVTPVANQFDMPNLPMAFDISMGLRLDDGALRKDVEGALKRRKREIDAMLGDYDIPRLDEASP
jgi:mxaJ protein